MNILSKYLRIQYYSSIETGFLLPPGIFFFFFFNGISQMWAATSELNDAANASTAGLKFFQQISQIHSWLDYWSLIEIEKVELQLRDIW